MKQDIVEKYGKEFKEIFNQDLVDFNTKYYGFDITLFEQTFTPETLLDTNRKTIREVLNRQYGKDAEILFIRITDWQVESCGLNSHLEDTLPGTQHEFVINNGEILTGKVFFPFVYTQNVKKYTVHHLPTGTSVIRDLNKKSTLDVLNILVDFADEMRTDDIFKNSDNLSSRLYEALKEYF